MSLDRKIAPVCVAIVVTAAVFSCIPTLDQFVVAVRVVAEADSPEKMYSTVMQSWRVMLCDDSGWLNIGLWEAPNTSYASAAEALAKRVSRGLPFAPGDLVLDVGCGEGDATLLWAQEARAIAEAQGSAEAATFVGINLANPQLEVASARAASTGATNARFIRANALELPHASGSVDAIIALESAFHFHPSRKDFFTEAARVLRSGGQLRLSDIICSSSARALRGLWAADWLSRLMNIPPENQVGFTCYCGQAYDDQAHTLLVHRSTRPSTRRI